jgi:hypothetical protein
MGPNKKATASRGLNQLLNRQVGAAPRSCSQLTHLQTPRAHLAPTNVGANLAKKASPAAPPAYRPQQTPHVLQKKTHAGIAQRQSPAFSASPPPGRYQPKEVVAVPETTAASAKTGVCAQGTRSVAPAVFRPQAPKTAQLKMATVNASRNSPVAPPVYRPHPTPIVLQKKNSSLQRPQASVAPTRPGTRPASRPLWGRVQATGRQTVAQAKRGRQPQMKNRQRRQGLRGGKRRRVANDQCHSRQHRSKADHVHAWTATKAEQRRRVDREHG